MHDHDAEFESYVAAGQARLLRTEYLLTGNQASAEDLVQTALAKLYLAWHKVHKRESLDGYVRRIMVNEHIS
ncbi:MAG: sigma factor [Nocardioidaceae bacterium]